MAGLLGDLHEFDLEEFRWRDRAAELRGEAPMGREGHGMATTGGRVYIFGGWHDEGWYRNIGGALLVRNCCRES